MAASGGSNEVVAVLRADLAQWQANLSKAAAQMQQFEGKMSSALGAIDAKVGSISFEQFGTKLSGLAGLGKDFVGSWLAAASQAEQFKMTLTALTGSASEAEGMLEKLQKFAGTTPFELEEVTRSAVSLRTLGQDVDRFLPLAGDLASLFGRQMPDAALALGKALSGSQDGLQILNDSFGITKRELLAAGAHMKDGGAVALDTAADLDALANAIEKVAAEKNFTGAMAQQMETLQGKVSNLSDEWNKFSAGLGAALAPVAKDVVGGLSGIVSGLNNLDAGQKAAIATGALWATGMAGVGSGLVGLVGALRAAQLALGPLAATLLSNPFGLALAGVVALTGAVMAYKAATEAADDALDATIKKEWEHLKVLKEKQKLLPGLAQAAKSGDIKSLIAGRAPAQELHRQGLSANDVAAMVAVKQKEFEHAKSQGSQQQMHEAARELAFLKPLKEELAKLEKQAKKTAEAMDPKEAKKKAKEAFEADKHAIEVAAVRGEITPQEQAKRLLALKDKHKLDPAEVRQLEMQAARLDASVQKKEESAAEKAARKAEQDRKRAEAQAKRDQKRAEQDAEKAEQEARRDESGLNAARREGIQLRQGGIDRRVSDLDALHERTGQKVLPEVKRLLLERLKLEEEAIGLEREQALAATENAETRAQIEQNAQLEIQAARDETARKLKDLTDQEIAEAKRAHDEKKKLSDQEKQQDQPFFAGPVGNLEQMLQHEKDRQQKEEERRSARREAAEEQRRARQEAITRQNAAEAERHGKTVGGMTEGERAQAARVAAAEAERQKAAKERLMATGKTEEEANKILGLPSLAQAAEPLANSVKSNAAKLKDARVPSTALKGPQGTPAAGGELKLLIEVDVNGETQTQEVTLKGKGGSLGREMRRFNFKGGLGSAV